MQRILPDHKALTPRCVVVAVARTQRPGLVVDVDLLVAQTQRTLEHAGLLESDAVHALLAEMIGIPGRVVLRCCGKLGARALHGFVDAERGLALRVRYRGQRAHRVLVHGGEPPDHGLEHFIGQAEIDARQGQNDGEWQAPEAGAAVQIERRSGRGRAALDAPCGLPFAPEALPPGSGTRKGEPGAEQ